MDELWELVGKKITENVPLPTHCNSPLKFSTARAALKKPSLGQYVSRRHSARTEWKHVLKYYQSPRIQGFDSSYHHYELLNEFLPPLSQKQRREWQQQQDIAREMWKINVTVINQTGHSGLPPILPTLSPSFIKLLQDHYARRCFFEEAVLVTGSDNAKGQYHWKALDDTGLWTASLPGYKFIAGKSIFVIITQKGVSLLSRDHLLVFSDLCAERYILMLTCGTSQNIQRRSLPLDTLLKLLHNGDKMLQKGGNEAYAVIYGLEASCSSRLVGDIKVGVPTGETYSQKVLSDLQEKSRKCDILELCDEREQILNEVQKDAHNLMQCYGLYRLWGHPTLEPLRGTTALRSITTNVRITRVQEAQDISNKFKEEFAIRYFAEKKTWPQIDTSKVSPTNVIAEAFRNLSPVPVHHVNYRRGHWSLIEFQQCFPVDPKFEILEMLSDKALSLDTDTLKERLLEGQGPGTSIERSVILNWLNSTLSDPGEFLRFIDLGGFPSFERSVGLREKEREGKLDARLFGLMTLYKRMYIVLTEALLAEHIIPLFPEITMVDDELSLDKKRLQFTRSQPGRVHLFTSLDFSKWNSNMRENETQPVFKSFDALFGFNRVYQRTHEMFKSSLMYLLNGSYTPKLQDGEFVQQLGSWFGHLGGIEGLRQKGWTIWTVCLILLCAEKTPIQLRLMGQGDNQILKQVFPHGMQEDKCLQYHYQFTAKLNDMLSKIGPPLKMEETWTSKDLFIYGKYVIYKGVALETSYKRLVRMFKMSNEDFPTIESAISSMTANVSSSLSCSTSLGAEFFIYISELVGLFQLFFKTAFLQVKPPVETLSLPGKIEIPGAPSLQTGPVLTPALMNSDHFFLKLCLLPRILGGFPVASLPSLMIRGFPDNLELDVSFLKIAYKCVSQPIQRFIKDILSPQMNPNISFELLLENPLSLNLYIPSSPGEARRNSIITFLKEQFEVRNPFFKEFLYILGDEDDRQLIWYLDQCKPVNPIVLSTIYNATVQARARKVAGKLQKTRTLSKVAVTEGQIDLYSIIRKSELNHLRSVLYIVAGKTRGPVKWNPDQCSETHSRMLRELGWKKEIIGLSCASPLEIMQMESNTPVSECSDHFELDKGFITLQTPPFMSTESLSDSLIAGPYQPYRGSTTKQKVGGSGSHIISYSSPLLAKVVGACNIIGWATPLDGNLRRVIEQLLASVTDIPMLDILPLDDSISGSVHHRLESDYVDKGGAVSVLPNYGSKMRFDTCPLVAYSKGSKNVTLMFQSLMSYASVIKATEMEYSQGSAIWPSHLHIQNSCCIKEVDESMIDGPDIDLHFTSRPHNPFLYIKKEKAIPADINVAKFPALSGKTNDPEELHHRLIGLVAYRIFDILEVPNWSRGHYAFSKPGIVINWAFRLPLLKTLEVVALLILSFFSSSIHDCSAREFIQRVTERVIRSDLEAWLGLSNLIHCPNFHHELVKPPYGSAITGNPELTGSLLSVNVKRCVEQILSAWSQPISGPKLLAEVIVRAPVTCGVMLHPSILHLIQNWCVDQTIYNPIRVRHAIVATLNNTVLNRNIGYQSSMASQLINLGANEIVLDDLDVLCKRAPVIVNEIPPHHFQDPPPPAHQILGTCSRSSLIYQRETYAVSAGSRERDYTSHKDKIANLPTTGPYKGVSLMNLLKDTAPERILCCGDGAGGFSHSALLCFPNTQVFFNTLITSSNPIQSTPPIPFLPSLAGSPDLETRLNSLGLVNDNITDLMNPDYPKMFRKKFAPRVDAVVCDAECLDYLLGVKPLQLANAVANVAHTLQSDHLIFKTYSLDHRTLALQISCILSYYESLSIVRCHFSNKANTEVYLYAKQRLLVRPITFQDTGVEGFLLPVKTVDTILKRRNDFSEDYALKFMLQYTEFLDPEWRDKTRSELSHILPFFSSKDKIEFPSDLQEWFQTTSMSSRGKSKIKRAVLKTEKLSHRMVTRWALQWILTFLLVDPSHLKMVQEGWNNLTLIWYKTQGDGWDVTMGFTSVPGLPDSTSRVWPISQLLRSKHSKFIYKAYGVARSSGICVNGRIGDFRGRMKKGQKNIPLSNTVYRFLSYDMASNS